MSIINDDPAVQAAVDESRGVKPVITGTPIPITVQKVEDDSPSMPEGGLKPLSNPTPQIDIESALADDTPGTASFEGPKPEHDLSDFGSDFIEAPVEELEEEATEETVEEPAGKSIDIVDRTPEAEDLIGSDEIEETNTNATEEIKEEAAEENKMEPIEPITPIEPIAPIEPVKPAEPVKPIQHINDNLDINIDAEHAYEESNEDFFRATRENIFNLRRERNECIVSADKKEDELTTIERRNSQYEIAGEFDKIDRESIDALRNEIRDIRGQADAKDRAIRSALKIIRAL